MAHEKEMALVTIIDWLEHTNGETAEDHFNIVSAIDKARELMGMMASAELAPGATETPVLDAHLEYYGLRVEGRRRR